MLGGHLEFLLTLCRFAPLFTSSPPLYHFTHLFFVSLPRSLHHRALQIVTVIYQI